MKKKSSGLIKLNQPLEFYSIGRAKMFATSTIRRSTVLLTAVVLLLSTPTAWGQTTAATPTAAELAALQPMITAEIQAEIAAAPSRFINGASLTPKITTQSSPVSPNAAPGINYFRASYCYSYSGSSVFEVVVFIDGTYVFTTNSALFATLASACPTAATVAVDVVSTNGNNFAWDTFYVLHN